MPPRTPLTPRLLRCGLLAACAAALHAADPTPAPTMTTSAPSTDATVKLDPFEVSAVSDKGYGELNSNSITAFKTELSKMPVSADVFDQTLLNDTGITTVEQALEMFSAGAGVASGQPDTAAANSQYLDRASGTLSLRGLQAPTTMINGFFPAGGGGISGNGISTTFDLEKIEVINGPQALLYGVSGAGGVVNLTTKQARFGQDPNGRAQFRVDQYGNKMGQLDYGMGNDWFAVRAAYIDQKLGSRRLFYGGPLVGDYLQIAIRPIRNTTLRFTYQNQTFDRINANAGNLALTALSTTNDARNGQILNYLIATNQLTAAANGAPSGAGPIPGVNWNTVASFGGAYSGEFRDHHQYMATADTVWLPWLSSQLNAGYRIDTDTKIGNSGITYDAPNVAANPTGTFAVVLGTSAQQALWEPTRQKVIRFSLLADNHLFGDRVHSQSIAGIDATRTDGATISAYYVAADSNWNPINSGSTTNNGLLIMPTQYWAVPNGPVRMALFNPEYPRINYTATAGNGQVYTNWVRAYGNATNPALISPGNPEGLTGNGTADFRHQTDIQSGWYGANFTEWFDGKLTTLAGFRVGRVYDRGDNEASLPNPPSILNEVETKFTSFNFGLNGQVVGPLRAYAEFSDSYDPPGNSTVDPYGNPMKTAHGVGEEAGLKASTQTWNLSGSLAFYHARSKNETLSFTSTIARDINPTGLNGIYNAGSNLINVDRTTQGVQLAVTATPGNWRLRLSAATVKSTILNGNSYGQLYNDQFHENAAGNVTFADNELVYVPATYNSKTTPLAVTQANAPAGYVPLTVALMNNPSSTYYANPAPVSSEISGTTAITNVLRTVDPKAGAILTGVTGLPISMLQVAPNAGSPPPGNIVVTQAGDAVSGFPRYALSFLNLYTLPNGWLQGLRVGGSINIAWKTSQYYYYPQGVSAVNSPRIMLYEPTETLLNGIVGYSRKYRRFTFDTQLNVNNMFNHYHVLLLPSYVNGWAGPDNATIDQTPRTYVWSASLAF